MGYTYRAEAIRPNGSTIPVIIREQFMPMCSTRADDGVTVVTPEDVAPTVDTFLKAFIKASEERRKVSLMCPSIIRILDTFHANGTYYYVVEYLRGETLDEYVKAHGPLSFEEAREVLAPIFDAVRTLHSQHMIHTDISPRHIRFQVKNGTKIPVLFNLYYTIHFRDDNMQTWAMSAPHCTEGYAPPEQYTTISNFYPQTDIYALAATLVFALTGRHLPDSRTLDEQEIRAFLPPAFPETYVQALIHALRPDINDRTESISDFREDLVAFYGGTRREQTDEDNDYDTDSRPPLYKRILAWLGNFRGCKK